MNLYLDEDSASVLLVRILQNAGHDVEQPSDVGLGGESDVVQFTSAIRVNRVCLTKNYCDFEDLHNLLEQAHGSHPGILVIR